ncbi:MAG TPA: pyrroline-5-carboxylate reductase [Clostridiaceae bacterium]
MINKNVLFIGAGNMGEGILKGALTKKVLAKENISFYEVLEERLNYIKSTYAIKSLASLTVGIDADILIIAVKPQDINSVLEKIKANSNKNCIVVSIAAGISIGQIENILGEQRKIVRVMPNPLCESGFGITALCPNSQVSEGEFEDVKSIFQAIGEITVIKERLFDAFTGFSGSGGAFVFEFIEAMIEAGVYVGFSASQSALFATQNIMGAAKMMMDTKKHPALFKERISSPAGTTIAGLHVLNKSGFKGIIQECVKAAADRSKELGK